MSKKPNNRIKMNREDIIFHAIGYFVFSILIVVFAYPFYFLLISTISNNAMVNLNQITLYPVGIHFDNYIEVFKLERIRSGAVISVARTLVGTCLSLAVTTYAAYFFTKEEMWHKKFWYRFTVATMYFGAGTIPVYLNYKLLGLLNNFWVYVIPGCLSVYNMILVKTYIESLPTALEEAAEMDGAGYMTRFLRIVLPLCKPILATIGLFAAVGQWNSIFDTKMYINNSDLYPLQFVLYEYYNQVKSIQEAMSQAGADQGLAQVASSASVRLTMTAVTVIPIICVYPFIQKYYMKGIMIGAVKG